MTKLKRVLVVGDWLVDELWVVGKHRSPSAGRPGPNHTRALQIPQSTVRSLCGAGQVAVNLRNARDKNGPLFDVIGLGLWHRDDQAELCSMLDPNNNIAKTPHRLMMHTPPATPSPDRAVLHNLADDTESSQLGTTRIIRVFEQKGDRVAHRDRLDWELPFDRNRYRAIRNGLEARLNSLDALAEADIVVIKDLGKGAISSELIDLLTTLTPAAAQWYISSKTWKSSNWYRSLPNERVAVYLVPQMAARKAIQDEKVATSNWITKGGVASSEAMSAVNEVAEDFPNARVVVLPSGMKVLARDPSCLCDSKEPCGYVQPNAGNAKFTNTVPMASVFLPALIANASSPSDEGFDGALSDSLSFTDHWMREEYLRIVVDDWKHNNGQTLDISKSYFHRYDFGRPVGWNNQFRHWNDSRTDKGIVLYEEQQVSKLQLWRAMTEVSEYIATVPRKRKMLKTLVEYGRQFHNDPIRHMAFLLIDSPGSGKSYLASRLAKQVGMKFLSFNITQMLSRRDLLHAFDIVVTRQAQNPDEKFLVFVDELNVLLDGRPPYDAFLAPLEDGNYIRSGNTFQISPCFWVFAGTRRPTEDDKNNSSGISFKGSDFESRLTAAPFQLGADRRDEDDKRLARLENIYVAGIAIRRFFPDVREVSEQVLEALNHLPPSFSPRDIAQFVKRFREVQYGQITARNLPLNWHEFGEHNVSGATIQSIDSTCRDDVEENMVTLQLNPYDDVSRYSPH